MELVCTTCYQTYWSETGHFCGNNLWIPGVARSSITIQDVANEIKSVALDSSLIGINQYHGYLGYNNQQHEVDEIRNRLFNTSEQINEFVNFFTDNISNVVLGMEMHRQSGDLEQNMLRAQLDDQSGYLAHVEDPQSFQDSILQTAHSLINLLTVSRSKDSLHQDVFRNIDPPILNLDNETPESLNFRENMPQETSNEIEAADEIEIPHTHIEVPIDFAVANSSKDQDCGIGEEHMEIIYNQRKMNQYFEIFEQTPSTMQMGSRPIHAGNFEDIDQNKNMHLLRYNPTTHTVCSSLPDEERSGCNTSEKSVADFTMATSKQSSELDDGSSMRYEEVSVEKQIPNLETSKKIDKTSMDYTNKVSGSVKIEKDRFICHVCGKQFRYKCKLEYHSLFHSNVKAFTCEVCERKFKTKCILRNHMSFHFKRHRCSFCQKLFARKHLLKEHTLQHTGEKPFQCNICGKSFGAKRHLSMHMYTHLEL